MRSEVKKPKIIPLHNGPLYFMNDFEKKVVPNLEDSNGQPISTVHGTALCRCGASRSKPFCDGTHGEIRFSDANSELKIDYKRKDYVGKKIVVHDVRRICSHAKECVNNLPAVFRFTERPWISPDGSSLEKIIEIVNKCPSGALSYTIDGIEYKDQDRMPKVIVTKNGPLNVTGGIELVGVSWPETVSREHYALCRCGHSNNKPFCDGTHSTIDFKDSG
jgi:CDGSH-type Zn-finger protein